VTRFDHDKVLCALAALVTLTFATAAAASGGHELTFAEHMGRVFIHLVNFLLFVGLLVYLLRRPVADMLGNRRLSIATQMAESRDAKAAAEARFADLQQRIAAFDGELTSMLERVRAECEVERERSVITAHQAAEAMKQAAERTTVKELDKARHELREWTVDRAMVVAEQVLRASVGRDDHRRLTAEYFERIAKDAKS